MPGLDWRGDASGGGGGSSANGLLRPEPFGPAAAVLPLRRQGGEERGGQRIVRGPGFP